MKKNKINQYVKAIVKVFLSIGVATLSPAVLAVTDNEQLKAVVTSGNDLLKGVALALAFVGIAVYSVYTAGATQTLTPLMLGLAIIVGGGALVAYAMGAFTLLI